jgi:hypothetical protein
MTAELFLGLALIGIVQAITKATQDKNGEETLPGWAKVFLSATIGLAAGVFGTYYGYDRFAGIDPLTGLMIGLAASGGVTLFKVAGESFGKGMARSAAVLIPLDPSQVPVRGEIGQDVVSKAIKENDPIAPYAANETAGLDKAGEYGVYDPEHHGKG